MFLDKKLVKGEIYMNPEEVGNRLKSIMHLKGIRREDVAKRMKISYASLTRKLNGKREFNIKDILKLKEILELDGDFGTNIFFNPDFTIENIKEKYAIEIFNKEPSEKAK